MSAICAIEDCDSAVHVHLVCAECKRWLHQASHDPTAPELPRDAAMTVPPGQYVARLLVDDSYRVVAETPRFRVPSRAE